MKKIIWGAGIGGESAIVSDADDGVANKQIATGSESHAVNMEEGDEEMEKTTAIDQATATRRFHQGLSYLLGAIDQGRRMHDYDSETMVAISTVKATAPDAASSGTHKAERALLKSTSLYAERSVGQNRATRIVAGNATPRDYPSVLRCPLSSATGFRADQRRVRRCASAGRAGR